MNMVMYDCCLSGYISIYSWIFFFYSDIFETAIPFQFQHFNLNVLVLLTFRESNLYYPVYQGLKEEDFACG